MTFADAFDLMSLTSNDSHTSHVLLIQYVFSWIYPCPIASWKWSIRRVGPLLEMNRFVFVSTMSDWEVSLQSILIPRHLSNGSERQGPHEELSISCRIRFEQLVPLKVIPNVTQDKLMLKSLQLTHQNVSCSSIQRYLFETIMFAAKSTCTNKKAKHFNDVQ